MTKITILQIDTEGYDYEILKTVPFEHMQPAVVYFEHLHLSKEDNQEAVRLLKIHGYHVFQFGGDYFGVRSLRGIRLLIVLRGLVSVAMGLTHSFGLLVPKRAH